MPIVSAILPLYNGSEYICESIESIISQTFTDWELIIVNEYNSDIFGKEIVEEYAKTDHRIKMIQNEQLLGLAESLNKGIAAAEGKYIARIDVDDPSYPERFFRQVQYLDSHPEIFMCGTLTRSVLPNNSYILDVPCELEELKAAMLFGCEISHCSVMFRREDFIKKHYYYDPKKLSEDYDLWMRIMFESPIVNLPEVLADHRWGFESISSEKGEALYKEVNETSAKALQRYFGIEIPERDHILLSSWRKQPKEFASKYSAYFLKRSYSILTEIERKNSSLNLIDPSALKKILWKRWKWVCESCGIAKSNIPYEHMLNGETADPEISVILPVLSSAKYLCEAVDSIINQDFSSWELIIVCEQSNSDGSTEIAELYADYDKRIKVIVNRERLGLAGSLNAGIACSKGKYIARIDSDDISHTDRLSAQYSYMEKHPNTGITQFYQRYIGKNSDGFIHRPPVSAKEMKANLLFFCDACHSTIMMRRSVLDKYDLRYNVNAQLEDYDLWIRAVKVTDFETIPKIYGEYRVEDENISLFKKQRIQNEMCRCVSRQLKDNLGLELSEDNVYLLGGWVNIFESMSEEKKQEELEKLRCILLNIWKANKKTAFYDKKALLNVIAAKWRWSKYNEPWQGKKKAGGISRALELHRANKKKSKWIRKIAEKPLRLAQRFTWHINAETAKNINDFIYDALTAQTEDINNSIKRWTWERYQRLSDRLDILEQQYGALQNGCIKKQSEYVPYIQGEKVRIVFLFQIASFWPSWDSLYQSCKNDEQTDTKLVFLDETNTERSQMLTARSFLDKNNFDYIPFDKFDIEKFSPHIIVIQTPYDEWHRQEEHWSDKFRKKGYRVVYIPYGVEISDTEDSHKLHFRTNVINNCWRIYTFSDTMKSDYLKYNSLGKAVRALGLPRFDYFYRAKNNRLPPEAEQIRNGRPIVLWKVHFPKTIRENGKSVFVTPSPDEYLKFSERIKDFNDFFFVFMPHPKFAESSGNIKMQKKISGIISNIAQSDNAWTDTAEDYRQTLSCADYIIIDRSAVMVEAGALNVPVLYMTNPEYNEPLTAGIKPLIDSYYHGVTCDDMIHFLQMCCEKRDVMGGIRSKAFEQCIPYFDGNAGNRVKEDMKNGVVQNEE